MKKRTKQIMAWILIVILVLMYLSTLVFALIDTKWAAGAFRISIVSTILLPIMFYLIIFFTRLLTPAHVDPEKIGREAEEESGQTDLNTGGQ